MQVAGVRYRAWQPPSALHPTIPSDSPLVFDLVDAGEPGVAGAAAPTTCRTPAAAPTTSPPVNAIEAESRRTRRFEATGFTPAPVDMSDIREKQARLSTDVGAPGILDLRRVRTVLR